jgi:hypothetical protein
VEKGARTIRASEKLYRETEVAGSIPHYMAAPATFSAEKEALRGPWADAKFGASVPVTWPSWSGPGTKVSSVRTVPNYAYLINWFDPARPEYTPNAMNDAFRDSFEPMPPLPETIPPGLLVTVKQNGKIVPFANVFAVPLDAQNTSAVGVRADSKGTAWIWLKEPGRYRLDARTSDGNVIRQEIRARRRPLDAPPGYDYLQRVQLGS